MIWKKAELAALPCLAAPKSSRNDTRPLWTAAVVKYQGEKILQVEAFENTGEPILRHWVAPGCEKYISLRADGTWSGALLATQEPFCKGHYYSFLSEPQKNVMAESTLVDWDKNLGKWREPLLELADRESTAASRKRWNRKNTRDEKAMSLFKELRPEDLAPPPEAEKAAWEEIKKEWGSEGWMLYWPYKVKEPLTGEWIKCSKGYCTACSAQTELWPEDMPEEYETIGHCPMCGAEVRYCRSVDAKWAEKAIKTVKFRRASTGAALAIQYLTGVWYDVTVMGRERRITENCVTQAINVAIFSESKAVSIAGCEGYFGNWKYTGNWHPEERVRELWGVKLPIQWQELQGTPLDNSHVWDYVERAWCPQPVGYCAQYLRYPSMENLVSAGLYGIVNQMASGYLVKKDVADRKQASPSKMLGLSKPEIARAKEERWDLSDLEAYKWLRARNLPTDKREVKSWAVERGKGELTAMLQSCAGDKDRERDLYRYLRKHALRDNSSMCGISIIYRDYLRFAKELGYDMTDQKNLFPHQMKLMHDRLAKQVEQRKNQKLDKKIQKVANALERFCWAADGLTIRPARSAAELSDEGKLLHHCVGTYAKRYSEGKTALFFIRRIEEPEVPYYTLELRERDMIVVQNHGDHNKPQTPEIKEFERKWLAWAKKQEAARRAEEKKARLADDCKKNEKEHAA